MELRHSLLAKISAISLFEKMSGLGPAACWLTHKRIESWSRIARERVGAVRRVTLDRNSEDNNGATTSASSIPPPPPMTPPPSASSVTSTTSGIGSGAGSVSDSCDLPTDSEVSIHCLLLHIASISNMPFTHVFYCRKLT